MKKLLSLVVAILMALSLAAVAETETTYVSYQHPTIGYTLEYPADWFVLDSETINAVMALVSGDESLSDIDFEAYAPQVIEMQMAMFMDNYGNNISVALQPMGIPLAAADFLTIMPTLRAQYEATMPGIQFIDEGSVYEAEGKQYARVVYGFPMGGQNMYGEQYYDCASGDMYLICLTALADQDEAQVLNAQAAVDHILASFAY